MQVHYTEDMADVISKINPPVIHVLAGTNSDRYAVPVPPEMLQVLEVCCQHNGTAIAIFLELC